MAQVYDSHKDWLNDNEYREAFGRESAGLEAATVLARARSVVGVTQTALAEQAGVSQGYIGKLERGDANPTVGTLAKLLAAIWMKVEMRPVPIDPTSSVEAIVLAISEPELDEFEFTWKDVASSTSGNDRSQIKPMLLQVD